MDLKPCPFCGFDLISYDVTSSNKNLVCCKKCSASIDNQRQWNTRTSGWISVDDSLPEGHEYVVLKHKDDGVPPTIGWATYWQPKNRFAGFEVQCASYLEDYSNEFTHWMPLPQMPEVKND